MFSGNFFEELEKLSAGRIEYTRANGLPASLRLLRDDLKPQEIERARRLDALWVEYEGRGHIVANFLPDGERPADARRTFPRGKEETQCKRVSGKAQRSGGGIASAVFAPVAVPLRDRARDENSASRLQHEEYRRLRKRRTEGLR